MQIDFDLNSTQELTEFEPLPEGQYLVELVGEELGEIREGKQSLKLIYRVLDGQRAGDEFFDWVFVRHASEAAVGRTRKYLKSLGVACNRPVYRDTCELMHIPFSISVILTEDNKGRLRNEIKKFEARSSSFSGGAINASATSSCTPG